VFDNSEWNWKKKKELFTGLDITIITPCIWLANLVKKSFLKEYPVKVIYNGIDLNVFKPTEISNVKKKYGLDKRPMVLGVASEWTTRKGLNDFIKISMKLSDVQFVVVGVTEEQLKLLPNNIKGIKRTSNASELAEIYSAADLFFNPTYEDNFPTTNLEALACGTPVVTYDTGGSPEAITKVEEWCNSKVGKIIKKTTSKTVSLDKVAADLLFMLGMIERKPDSIGADRKFSIESNNTNGIFDSDKKDCITREMCRKAALCFDMNSRLRQYLEVYQEVGL
jgi:glycosyltransferase involved in cell wall biosynthesis